jgi:hypothetical protein
MGVALSGLILLTAAYFASESVATARAAEASVAGLRAELEGARARLAALEARHRGDGDVLTSQIVLTAQLPPARVLAELGALLPADVRLDGLALRYGALLEIDTQLVAQRPAAYDAFLDRLSDSSFQDVLPGAEVREGEMHASVRMVRRPGS